MIVRQGNNARIVMTCGKVIAEFVEGAADVSTDAAALLSKMGYEVEEVQENDASGKADVSYSRDKPRKGRKLS